MSDEVKDQEMSNGQDGGMNAAGPGDIPPTADEGPGLPENGGSDDEGSKVIDLGAAQGPGPEKDEKQGTGQPIVESGIFELGPPEMVKPIYALGSPGRPFIEKIQGCEMCGGVLVRWNNTAAFFPGARLDEGADGSYIVRI